MLSSVANAKFFLVVRDNVSTNSYVVPFTISTAGVFVQQSITIPGPSTFTGYPDIIITSGITGAACAPAASTWYYTSSGATAPPYCGYLATTSDTSFIGTTGAYVYITSFQVETGTVATALELRDPVLESNFSSNLYIDQTLGQGNLVCSGSISAQNMGMFRNRIINGDARLDYVNSLNVPVSVIHNSGYVAGPDMWYMKNITNNVFTFGKVNITNLSDFNTAMRATITSSSSATLAAGGTVLFATAYNAQNNFIQISQATLADLQWGSSFAQSATFSFWIFSTVATTFYSSFQTSSLFEYAYNSPIQVPANVWVYKTINIPGLLLQITNFTSLWWGLATGLIAVA